MKHLLDSVPVSPVYGVDGVLEESISEFPYFALGNYRPSHTFIYTFIFHVRTPLEKKKKIVKSNLPLNLNLIFC